MRNMRTFKILMMVICLLIANMNTLMADGGKPQKRKNKHKHGSFKKTKVKKSKFFYDFQH